SLSRFECQGTADVVKLMGLAKACELHLQLDPDKVSRAQIATASYLYKRLNERLKPIFRTPALRKDAPHEASSMVAFYFDDARVPVDDLREELWKKHHIWVQPDFLNKQPGHGMRISCHVSTTEEDIDRFVTALEKIVK